jgi:hypothetical protein
MGFGVGVDRLAGGSAKSKRSTLHPPPRRMRRDWLLGRHEAIEKTPAAKYLSPEANPSRLPSLHH